MTKAEIGNKENTISKAGNIDVLSLYINFKMKHFISYLYLYVNKIMSMDPQKNEFSYAYFISLAFLSQ